MTRTRKPTSSGRHRATEPGAPAQARLSPTPVPSPELLARAAELRGLLAELAGLTGSGGAWSAQVLRRNIELALLSPETLDSADNQLDFIEELAEAVWDSGDVGFRCTGVRPAGTPEETCRRDERRRAVLERLDEIAYRLCEEAEAWQDRAEAAAEGSPRHGAESPG